MTSKEIRRKFLEFFESKGHKIVPSSPVVNKSDPTLMFINAGMNPFKDFFMGNAAPKNARIADTQKCLRVSGKHNDLDEVGHDTYHHTLFEMLGNWSIGDYFKEDAINWAWELLTEVYGLDKDRLYITIFGGDQDDGLPRDNEAEGIWAQHVAADRILDGGKKDNFWEMGESGPCGPCSEIHIDLRGDADRASVQGASLVNNDHPQVVEIWNLVFMQFNRKANGTLEDLPAQHIDTGMGFERLCMALQGKQSNYDTDVFTPLLNKISGISGIAYGNSESTDIAQRVIADHIRAVAFAIADGQLPSSSGAGYVIRRILRRAIRYGFSYLDLKTPFMFQLVETLEAQMGEFFPEISTQKSLVMKVIEEEEQSFLRTLAQGLAKLHDFIAEGSKTLDGKRAFELYDTYGFPIDLTELIMRENDKVVDLAEFTAEMTAQKERSRAATKLSTDDWTVLEDDETQEFVGYDYTSAEVRITRYRKVSAKNKAFYQLVLSLTPFYPEGGGQLGDTGILVQGDQKIGIFDTKKENGIIVHFTKELPSDLSGSWSAEVSESKRRETAKNHSATHLMHEALREVLGTHVEQKGSLVNSEYLRFDFSHFQKVSDEELQQIESLVNQRIQANLPLEEFRNIPISEAKDMGAMMLFGEKYGDTVRAIKFGSSIELCGGIHVQATGSIGLFKFISEGAVAAGMRRVEAVTGMGAMKYINDSLSALRDAAEVLKNPKNLAGAIQQLKEKEAASQKEVEAFRKEKAMAAADELENNAEDHGGVRVIAARTAMDAGSVKDMVFKLKGQGNTLVIFANAWEGKATVSIGISDEVVADKGWHAGNAVRALAQHIQGGGGGQPAFATAGGNNPEGLDKVLSDWKNHFAL
ncbi:MAG TPA: alanine--tRNA ligase [Cryomorphaceae bacterium]|nr:alanine--tRNA ligase [Cryomorphaceae bacterium]